MTARENKMGICKRDGCDDDTVAVQLVRLDQPELLKDWCRPHHVQERRAACALDTVEVTTNRAIIMGVDGSENRRGARIELDHDEIDIDMLVNLGYVTRVEVDPQERLLQIRAESADLEARLADVRQRELDAQAAAAATDLGPQAEVSEVIPAADPAPAKSTRTRA